jgi:hypothetical protein
MPGGADHEHGSGHAHGDLRHVAAGAEPAVYAGRTRLSFDPPAAGAEILADVAGSLQTLAARLAADGCVLIGHIKGSLDAGEQGRAAFSLTAPGDDPRWAGALSQPIALLDVTLNVIVFGVTDATARDAVLSCWPTTLTAATTWA